MYSSKNVYSIPLSTSEILFTSPVEWTSLPFFAGFHKMNGLCFCFWTKYVVILCHCQVNVSFMHFYMPINFSKHYKGTHAVLHALRPERDRHLTLHPETWHPWADWNNRCDNVMVPEILPQRWYKYCHPLLMPCLALCWLSHPVFLCQGWAGVQIPSTGLCSSVEVSRCWSCYITSTYCFNFSTS